MRSALTLLALAALLAAALAAQPPAPHSKPAPVLAWASDDHLLINNNGLLVKLRSADVGRTTQLANPVRLSATPGKEWGPAPAIGQHSEEVLASYGFSPAETAELRAKDVVKQREG